MGRFFLILLCIFFGWSETAIANEPTIAFYYGKHLPVAQLAQFNRVVIQPDDTNALELRRLQHAGAKVFGYLSVGEADHGQEWIQILPAGWVLGRNSTWHSRIMDLTQAGWRKELLKRIDALWQKGYRGLFLDTLDSYQLVLKTPAMLSAQRAGILKFLTALHEQHPDMAVILNRGFDLLPEVNKWIVGVAAESLFKGWNQETHSYGDVSEKNRQWLLGHLKEVRSNYHLPVYVIDYVPPQKRSTAENIASRIMKLGFVPWVTNADVNAVGVGAIIPVPRRVLMLYDSSQTENGLLANAPVHQLAALPLEYMGYVPTYWDVRKGLPTIPLNGRYAGIVTWFGKDIHISDYPAWLDHQMVAGIPVAVLGSFGFTPSSVMLARMGMNGYAALKPPYRLKKADGLVGYEATAKPSRSSPRMLKLVKSGGDTAHLTFKGGNGASGAAVVTGKWGGVALGPWTIEEGFSDRQRWVVNPFTFFRLALRLKPFPVADVTTENGRRIWISEVDGDGVADIAWMAGKPWAADVIRRQVFEHYKLPVTASVIVGELANNGIFPKEAEKLQSLARMIFKLPYVEIGSHTYSHPFTWEDVSKGMLGGKDGYNLPIKNYHFNLKQEIGGAAQWIDKNLAPPGKHTRVIQWSGDALPPEKALELANEANLKNINGGNTIITKSNRYLTNVSPMALPLGQYIQVYAPAMNEDIYTNLWKGPFWGFRNVIQTFKMTDRPRRLKPIDVYYHFYSGSKYASLKALKDVIDWTLTQPIIPIYSSNYSTMVVDFYRRVAFARANDGAWLIHGARALRTLRLGRSMGWPDLKRSKGVVGFTDLHDKVYVSLDGRAKVVLYLVHHRPKVPYLVQANATLQDWTRKGKSLTFNFQGFQPVRLEIGGTSTACSLDETAGRVKVSRGKHGWWYAFPTSHTGDVRMTCP